MKFTHTPKGLSVPEILVVVFVVAIVAAFLFPVVQSLIRSSQGVQCVNNLRIIGQGLRRAAEDHGDAVSIFNATTRSSETKGNGSRWAIPIQAYIGGPELTGTTSVHMDVFLCPASHRDGYSSFKRSGSYPASRLS